MISKVSITAGPPISAAPFTEIRGCPRYTPFLKTCLGHVVLEIKRAPNSVHAWSTPCWDSFPLPRIAAPRPKMVSQICILHSGRQRAPKNHILQPTSFIMSGGLSQQPHTSIIPKAAKNMGTKMPKCMHTGWPRGPKRPHIPTKFFG